MAGKSLGVPDNLKKKMCFCFFLKKVMGEYCWKNTGAKLKEFLMAKAGIVWAKEIILSLN